MHRAHVFEDFRQGNAELHQMRRQRQDFAEMAVGADQLQVGVEHRDALAHMVERGLQDLAVEMRRRMGIVEQL